MVEAIAKLIVGFVADLIVAAILLVISPYTGLPVVDSLDYWNWFWIVVSSVLVIGTAVSLSTAE